MDISKLPKFSQSDASPPTVTAPEASQLSAPTAPYSNRLAEAWVSIAIGVILLAVTPDTIKYFSSKVFHTSFTPFVDPTYDPPKACDYAIYTDGSKIYYRDLINFWQDLVVTAFAIVLIVDGLLMIRARRSSVVLAALCLTVLATAANLVYAIASNKYGFALLPALAVIFGGYIAISQWNAYKALSAACGHPVGGPDL